MQQIIIIDDALDYQLVMKKMLQANGYQNVMSFSGAQNAFNYLNMEQHPSHETPNVSLILMDLMMPEIDGIEACRKIRSTEHLKDIPIIMVTASQDIDKLEASFNAGASDYIHKPLSKIELLARVRSTLSLKAEIDRRKIHEQELMIMQKELEDKNKALQTLSLKDGLTGIFNRRMFNNTIRQEWGRAARDHNLLSLIMFDIDHFKQYNDNYGHQAGDECIKAVANTIKNTLHRNGDFVARYGGEEFVVVLPSTDGDGASVLAEKIRKQIMDLNIPHNYSAAADIITVSVGTACLSPVISTAQEALITMADQALYKAKKAGRNCVCSAAQRQKVHT